MGARGGWEGRIGREMVKTFCSIGRNETTSVLARTNQGTVDRRTHARTHARTRSRTYKHTQTGNKTCSRALRHLAVARIGRSPPD